MDPESCVLHCPLQRESDRALQVPGTWGWPKNESLAKNDVSVANLQLSFTGKKNHLGFCSEPVSPRTDVGRLQRECDLRAFPSVRMSIWAGGQPGASLGAS